MRLELRSRVEPDAELIGLSVTALTALLAVVWLNILHGTLPKGLLCRATHIPCPFCAGTRSLTAFLAADFSAALRTNPLVGVGLIVGVLWCVYALIVLLFRLPRLRVTEMTARPARIQA